MEQRRLKMKSRYIFPEARIARMDLDTTRSTQCPSETF